MDTKTVVTTIVVVLGVVGAVSLLPAGPLHEDSLDVVADFPARPIPRTYWTEQSPF